MKNLFGNIESACSDGHIDGMLMRKKIHLMIEDIIAPVFARDSCSGVIIAMIKKNCCLQGNYQQFTLGVNTQSDPAANAIEKYRMSAR